MLLDSLSCNVSFPFFPFSFFIFVFFFFPFFMKNDTKLLISESNKHTILGRFQRRISSEASLLQSLLYFLLLSSWKEIVSFLSLRRFCTYLPNEIKKERENA